MHHLAGPARVRAVTDVETTGMYSANVGTGGLGCGAAPQP
jgi:hypothetical protein